MNRKITLALIVLLLLVAVVPQAFAAAQIEDGYIGADISSNKLYDTHPATTGASAAGSTFNASKGGYVTNVTFRLLKYGSPTGTLRAAIGCLSYGGDNYNRLPNGTVVAISDTILDVSTLTTSTANYTFVFDQSAQLIAGIKYIAYVYVETKISMDSTNNYAKFVYSAATAGVWYKQVYSTAGWVGSNYDASFEVMSDTEAAGDPPDEDPDTWTTPGAYEALINDFVSFIVPIIVMLLPALLLCFITRRVDKWLLLIGLAIGAGLGYYFGMVPLWLVFLVTIGLIGMAYQSVRGSG